MEHSSDPIFNKQPDPKTTRDAYVHAAFKDPQFRADVDTLEQLEKSNASLDIQALKRLQLLDDYGLTADELMKYRLRKILYIGLNEKQSSMDLDINTGQVTLTFNAVTTPIAEIDERLAVIKKMRKDVWKTKQPKRRGTNAGELLYAVARAKKRKQTFNQINTLLMDGTLPLYPHKTKRFTTGDDLRQFYNRYKP